MSLRATLSVHRPLGGARLDARRPAANRRVSSVKGVVVAKQERFDEGSAEVKRLVQRDLKDSSRDEVEAMKDSSGPKSLDELEKIFETSSVDSITAKPAEAKPKRATAGGKPESPFGSSSAKAGASPFGSASAGKPASPFGSASAGKAASPFGSSSAGKAASPFGQASGIQEPKGLSPNMSPDPVEEEPWWAFVKQLKTAQIVTVISFTLIILLMLSTFKIVLDSGAIHFNE